MNTAKNISAAPQFELPAFSSPPAPIDHPEFNFGFDDDFVSSVPDESPMSPDMPQIEGPRLVTPEPDNPAESETLAEIERQYCALDNAHFALLANWTGWAGGNDIGKKHLFENLDQISRAAACLKGEIAKLAERRVRD